MAKRHKHEEHENHERWLVSYADFITLLFAFFTVLYATSQSDSARFKEVAESIQKAFLSSGGLFPLKGQPLAPFEHEAGKKSDTPSNRLNEAPYDKNEEGAIQKIQEDLEGLFSKSTGLSLKHGDIEVYKSEQGFKIRLNEAIVYKGSSDKIQKEQVPFLYEVGKRLARLGAKIQVEGHTDSTEQQFTNNWQLSMNRSYNVVQFLVQGAHFPREKISVSGYGDTVPIASNETAEGRSRNRRVEISVITENPVSDLPW